MKYLKKYENFETPKNCYWKVRTDTPYFEISLGKIGITEDEQEDFIVHKEFLDKNKFIYIGLEFVGIGTQYFYAENPDCFKKYSFNGEVKITPEEVKEWQLKNDANKYNL